MVVNPFFEKTVRIQTDQGQRVIDTGLYAYLGHPAYVGFAGWVLSTPILLASAWVVVPALIAVVGLVIRTALGIARSMRSFPATPSTRPGFASA